MLLALLCFLVGVTAFAGGLTLVLQPDGSALQLPHSPLVNYLIPGLLLAGVIGVGNLVAGTLILRHSRRAHVVAFGAGVALAVWILAQMVLLRTIDGLQVVYLAAGIVIAVEAAHFRRGLAALALIVAGCGSASGTSSLMDQRAVFPDRTYDVTDAQDMLLFVDMASHDMMAGGLRATLAVTTDPDEPWALTREVRAEVTFGTATTARLVLDDDFVYDVGLADGAITRR